jgi:hypothetical protein
MRPLAVAAATFAFLLAAQVAADEVAIGPWRLGMSKEQVMGFARYQPYATVASKHGLETPNGTFLGETRKVTLMFDDDGGLGYIKVSEYEGDNFEDAGNGIVRIFDFFEKNLGGASIDGVDLKEGDTTTKLDRSVLKLLIVQTLGTAEDQNEKAKQEKDATMTMMFDMRPDRQPDGSVLHCQWGFNGRSKTYFVHLFQDRTTNPKRAAESIVSLQKQ